MKRRVSRKNRRPDVVIDKVVSGQFAQFDSLAKRLFAVPKNEVKKLLGEVTQVDFYTKGIGLVATLNYYKDGTLMGPISSYLLR